MVIFKYIKLYIVEAGSIEKYKHKNIYYKFMYLAGIIYKKMIYTTNGVQKMILIFHIYV